MMKNNILYTAPAAQDTVAAVMSREPLVLSPRMTAREALALQYVTEALAQETDLAVLGTELQEDGTGAAVLTASLEWRGTPLAVQVDVTL